MDREKIIIKYCKNHGDTEFTLEGRGTYRCLKCRRGRVKKRRKLVKRKLVEMFGGKCIICNYDRIISALAFHHVELNIKEFSLAHGGNTLSFLRMLKEAKKCLLVCANCHAEIHGGLVVIDEALINKQEEIFSAFKESHVEDIKK